MLSVNNLVGHGAGGRPPYSGGNDSNTMALLHLNNNTTNDASGGSQTWTARGDANGVTSPVKFGSHSYLFDGGNDYIDTPAHADYQPGAGDFSIDAWIYLTDLTSANYIFFYGNDGNFFNSQYFSVSAAGALTFGMFDGSAGSSITHTGTLSTSQWYHVYGARDSSGSDDLYIAIDGDVESSSVTARTIGTPGGIPQIGRVYYASFHQQYFYGNIDEFRYTTAVPWTANFTPPWGEYTT